MSLLNDPVGYDPQQPQDDWTPTIGLRRAAIRGGIAAAGIALLLAPLAAYHPAAIIVMWTRIPLAFGVAWLLFQAVQRAAGMVGPSCTTLALGLTIAVLVSNHFAFAIFGLPAAIQDFDWWVMPVGMVAEVIEPDGDDMLIGAGWFHPFSLLLVNLVPVLFGGGVAVALYRNG